MSFMLLGILNSQAAGGGAGAYDLLETTTLATSASSVTFTGLGSYSDYAHLQIRYVARNDYSTYPDWTILQFNSDTGANYKSHYIRGYGSIDAKVSSELRVGLTPGATSTANAFGVGVIDILDFGSTAKNTTTRTLSGLNIFNDPRIWLGGGLWVDTSAVTSITLDQSRASNFLSGSRFSLYGIKGA